MSSSVRKIKSRSEKGELKTILTDEKKKARLVLLVCGLLFVAGSLIVPRLENSSIPTQTNVTNNDTVTSFSQEPVKIDAAITSRQNIKTKNPPVRIMYPLLEIDIPVKEAKIIKGYWEVFPDAAGFGTGSSYPDEGGNQVIFAHARGGLFLPLKNAKVGQNIFVLTKDKWYQYAVTNIKEVLPTQIEVIAPTTEPILTLYTCSGYADSKRLIVTAKRLS